MGRLLASVVSDPFALSAALTLLLAAGVAAVKARAPGWVGGAGAGGKGAARRGGAEGVPKAARPAPGVAPKRSRHTDNADPLPRQELTRADRHARSCDLLLVLGSSLVVEPAASLVGRAIASRARVVLVNRGETPYDAAATLRVWSGIGEAIPPAVGRVKRALGEQPNRS